MPHFLPRTCLLKIPRQERSVEMVHLILDASIMVLSEKGMMGFTTNRVASVAGVSVGSVYQYFANKEAIVAGIVERGVLNTEHQLRGMIAVGGEPARILQLALEGVIDTLLPFSALIRELMGTAPMLSRSGIIAILEPRLMDITRDVILYSPYRLRGGPAALYVGVSTVSFTTLKWLAEQPPGVSREALVSVLVDQMQTLLVAV